MTCREFQERLSEWIDGDPPAADRARMEEHARACAECGRSDAKMREALQVLRSLPPVRASADFEEKLFARIRDRKAPNRRWVSLWASLGAGAAAAILFLLWVQERTASREKDRRIAELDRQLKDARAKPPVVVPGPPSGPTREELIRELGIEPHRGEYVSARLKKHLEDGDWYVRGEWMSPEKALELVRGPEPPRPEAPAPRPDEEVAADFLLRNGYTRLGDMYVRSSVLEELANGKLIGKAGEVIDPEALFEAYRKAHGLVVQEGRVITAEQANARREETRIEPPKGAVPRPETGLLDNLVLGPPAVFREMTLYPLLDDRPAEGEKIALLHDLVSRDRVSITDPGRGTSLEIRNRGTLLLYLPSGLVIAGGSFGRVVRFDQWIPPGETALVPALCAQPQELVPGRRFAKTSGHSRISPGLRAAMARGQASFWAELAAAASAIGLKDPSADQLYKAKPVLKELLAYTTAFGDLTEKHPGMRGVVVLLRNRIVGAEIFAHPKHLASAFEQLVGSCALDLVAGSTWGRPGTTPEVVNFLHEAYRAEIRPWDGVKELVGDRLIGTVSEVQGRPVALSLLAGGGRARSTEELLAAAPTRSGRKLERVLAEIEASLGRVPGAEKPRLVPELAAIASPGATQMLLGMLKDPTLREAAILALGERKDPAAAADVIALFQGARDQPAVLRASARALALLPDERGARELLAAAQSADWSPEQKKPVLDALPSALLQVKNRERLEKMMGELFAYYEVASARSGVDESLRRQLEAVLPSIRDALQALTGRRFASASEARVWWNRNRASWLSEALPRK